MLTRVSLFTLILVPLKVFSISNKGQVIIDEKFHRAAETAKNTDQVKAETLQRELFFPVHNSKYQSPQYGVNYGYGVENPQPYGYVEQHEGLYGQSGGLFPYGYSSEGGYGGNSGYGHTAEVGYDHGSVGYDHSGPGYDMYGLGQYLKKKLTLKKIFLPLAGIALIAAAGALSTTNPVLLQLGTIGSARKKRNVEKMYPMNPFVKPKLN